MDTNQTANSAAPQRSWITRALNSIEVIGNKLPDPAMLFLLLMIVVWIFSWLLSGVQFERSEEHTSELQSRGHLVCRLLLEKKNAAGTTARSGPTIGPGIRARA